MKQILAALLFAGLAWTQTAPPAPADKYAELTKTLDQLARAQKTLSDWPNLARYHGDNANLAPPAAGESRVVFMGDSITDGWGRQRGTFFPGKPYVNRGISGQTTPQMLLRFRPDVLALKPKAVIILAGVNDISGLATGPMTNEEIAGNLASMAELATSSGVKVVLSSILPTSGYHLQNPNAVPKTTLHPIERIRELNAWIRKYAREHGHAYADYYSAMVDAKGVLREDLSSDDIH